MMNKTLRGAWDRKNLGVNCRQEIYLIEKGPRSFLMWTGDVRKRKVNITYIRRTLPSKGHIYVYLTCAWMCVCPLSWEQACIYIEWIYVCICMCMRVCISTFFSNYAFQQWTRLTDGETRISETICIFQKTYAMIFLSSEMPVNQRYILYSAYNTPSIRKNIVIFGSENDCFRTKRA